VSGVSPCSERRPHLAEHQRFSASDRCALIRRLEAALDPLNNLAAESLIHAAIAHDLDHGLIAYSSISIS
jgi:hypothetical protein